MTDADFAARRSGLARSRAALMAAQQQAATARTGREGAAARAALADARQQASAAAEGFASFTDPRQQLGRLPDSSPFALFPVRLETRFVTGGDAEGAPQERLLVRIYPDDCSIDTFEPALSATELASAQRYWQYVWRAGRVEGDERAAWRDLVTAHGSGRAGYIADTYQPVNLGDQPAKAAASDQILVIATQDALPATEASAVAAYWTAAWAGAGDAAALQAAAGALDAAVGAARAAELIAGYAPFNLADAPVAPASRQDAIVSAAFVVFPPDPVTKRRRGRRHPSCASSPNGSSSPAMSRDSRCSRPSAAWSRCPWTSDRTRAPTRRRTRTPSSTPTAEICTCRTSCAG